jgi:hypothetical protein
MKKRKRPKKRHETSPVTMLAGELAALQLHDIRDLTIMVRKRKLKPEKGRRKDLRKIDSIIRDLHSITHPNSSAADSG